MDFNEALRTAQQVMTSVGLQVIGAIILWFFGRWLIGLAERLLAVGLKRRGIDTTISQYILSSVSILLNIILIVSILGYFGIEPTSFAALVAAAGIAIGAAWSGLLANFAAGAFLILLRPFKVGDFITAAGVTGTVQEMGLFVTTINTLDNVRTIVGNNRIFADNIQNFSANPYRRVDLVAQLSHQVDHRSAIELLKRQLQQIPNVITDPSPDVEILNFNLAGPVLAVRPYCNNNHYWQVYFDTNRLIRETFTQAGYPVPEQHLMLRGLS